MTELQRRRQSLFDGVVGKGWLPACVSQSALRKVMTITNKLTRRESEAIYNEAVSSSSDNLTRSHTANCWFFFQRIAKATPERICQVWDARNLIRCESVTCSSNITPKLKDITIVHFRWLDLQKTRRPRKEEVTKNRIVANSVVHWTVSFTTRRSHHSCETRLLSEKHFQRVWEPPLMTPSL